MKFSDFLNESAVSKTKSGHATYSSYYGDFTKVNDTSLKAVKAVLTKSEVEKKINKELRAGHFGVSPELYDGTSRIYGTHKDGDEVVVFVSFVLTDEIDADLVDYEDDFEEGDTYYSEWRAIVSLNSGKVLDVDRQDDNELYTKLSDAIKSIKGENY